MDSRGRAVEAGMWSKHSLICFNESMAHNGLRQKWQKEMLKNVRTAIRAKKIRLLSRVN